MHFAYINKPVYPRHDLRILCYGREVGATKYLSIAPLWWEYTMLELCQVSKGLTQASDLNWIDDLLEILLQELRAFYAATHS